MSTLYIDVKAYPGSSIPDQVIPEMVQLAGRLGLSVWAELNGVRTLARPGDDPAAIASDWRRALESKDRYKTASAR